MPEDRKYLVTCDGDELFKNDVARAALDKANVHWSGSRSPSNPSDAAHHRFLVRAASEQEAIDAAHTVLVDIGSFDEFAARPLRADEIDFFLPAPWDLPVRGFEVVSLWFGFPFDIFAYRSASPGEFRVQLSGEFDYRDSDGSNLHLDVEHDSWEKLIPLLALRHDKIEGASISAQSALTIAFQSGRRVSAVPVPGDKYANWEARGPTFSIEGTPGEPFVWSSGPWE